MVCLRLATCPRCATLFYVCRSCDHGRVYCCSACSGGARKDSLREIRRRYRLSYKGKETHKRAERRRRRRNNARRRQARACLVRAPASVGDQGTSAPSNCGTASARPSSVELSFKSRAEETTNDCREMERDLLATAGRAVAHCAVCGRTGTKVNLAANRGWWPRRRYRKSQ